MTKRVHDGCGLRNPWVKPMWIALILSQIVSWSVVAMTRSLWGQFGYVPLVMAVGMVIRWERVHSLRKMYVTWRP